MDGMLKSSFMPVSPGLMSSESKGLSVSGGSDTETRQAFQDFVAGTFYQQMLKSLRSSQGEIQYLGGGEAERMFRGQLDQHISEQLARDHGAAFAEPLYDSFRQHRQAQSVGASQQLDQFA